MSKNLWNRMTSSLWTPIVLTAAVLVLLILIRSYPERHPRPLEDSTAAASDSDLGSRAVRDSAHAAVRRVLEGYGLAYRIHKKPKPAPDVWTVQIPPHFAVPSVHLAFQESLAGARVGILKAETDPSTGNTLLQVGVKDSVFFNIHLVPTAEIKKKIGKIAVVIDDFGDRLDDLAYAFFEFEGEITISILPGRRFSARTAQEANRRGCEVILHLSMEPLQTAFREDGYTILTKMPREKIREAFQKAMDQVPYAVGVNNHMGSKATSDRQTMVDVLECVRQKGLYFMDSYTVASSVAYNVAMEMGLPTAKRDVFIDADGSEMAIRMKLQELSKRAKQNGVAVGIGHCHRNMLTALKKEMPRIREEGLRFVPLSEVVE